MLFSDDFSDPATGWTQSNFAEGETGYAAGQFRIVVRQPNHDVWANPKLDLSDVTLEVEGVNNGGAEDNSFGVICRQDARATQPAYYFFIISSDGYYGIGKATDGQSRLLSSRDMQFSEAIRQGGAANRVRAECKDSLLTLWANDVLLAQVSDADFTRGNVGLIAQSFEAGAVDVLFDNFRVTRP